jgi:hypothetical protein
LLFLGSAEPGAVCETYRTVRRIVTPPGQYRRAMALANARAILADLSLSIVLCLKVTGVKID